MTYAERLTRRLLQNNVRPKSLEIVLDFLVRLETLTVRGSPFADR